MSKEETVMWRNRPAAALQTCFKGPLEEHYAGQMINFYQGIVEF